ncbi:Putative transposase [Planctomycetes bacterium Poly30]|uniref:Transposase n=1 Tax=Saltatorellus ferox TaxID=2528018 RepID=A0A518EV80_9BACT|nr:Putative transposase [Planctomycetes bacterium Poly30]
MEDLVELDQPVGRQPVRAFVAAVFLAVLVCTGAAEVLFAPEPLQLVGQERRDQVAAESGLELWDGSLARAIETDFRLRGRVRRWLAPYWAAAMLKLGDTLKSLIPLGEAAGRPLKRLIDPDLGLAFQSSGWGSQYVPSPLVVNADGFSLHAATLIRKGQRAQLEKLCRYVTRPAISLERFDVRPDGMVSWLLRKAWRDGTKGFVMTPYQFMARLAALAPHPREHQLTYQGVLAPASSLRDLVVPRPVVRKEPKEVDVADEDAAKSAGEPSKDQRYICWADLLKRVFSEDVLSCPRCRGRRHMISVITDPETARKVLEGVRAAARRSSDSLGGRDPSSPGPSRSPPAEPEVRIPMPPRQARLDFGK